MTPLVTTLDNGTEFLRHDSGPGSDQVILFSTEKNMELLSRCSILFQMVPFQQLQKNSSASYTLCTEKLQQVEKKTVVPLVYAFLPNKLQRTYERMLEVIRNKVALNPQTQFCIKESGTAGV